MIGGASGEWTKALVVFAGEAALCWLRLLKPGFRHCFVVLGNEAGWLVIDPLLHRTAVTLLPPSSEFDLAARYRSAGHTVVVTTPRQPPHRPAPIRIFTCVEAVKRILGIHARLALTPWGLYTFFLKEEKRG